MAEQVTHEAIVTAVRAAAEEVFSTMLNLPIECHEPHQAPTEIESFDGVIAVVGIGGPWTGTGRLSLSSQFACRIAGALLGSSYEAVDEDVLDAVAEVANMIIGNVKTIFEEGLGPLGLSIPTVIFGRNYQTRWAGVKNWSVLPFLSGADQMEVHFCLMPTRQTSIMHRTEALQTA